MLTEFGLSAQSSPIADRVLELCTSAAEQLWGIGARVVSDFPEKNRSGILAFDFPNRDLAAIRKACLDAGVVLSLRGGWLRISPHAYINEDDIGRLVDVVKLSVG